MRPSLRAIRPFHEFLPPLLLVLIIGTLLLFSTHSAEAQGNGGHGLRRRRRRPD